MPEDLEDQLRAALDGGGEPRPGFAARVAARAVSGKREVHPGWARRWIAAAIVAALIALAAGVGVGVGVRRYQARQEQAAEAALKLQFALEFTQSEMARITDATLNRVTTHLQRSLNE